MDDGSIFHYRIKPDKSWYIERPTNDLINIKYQLWLSSLITESAFSRYVLTGITDTASEVEMRKREADEKLAKAQERLQGALQELVKQMLALGKRQREEREFQDQCVLLVLCLQIMMAVLGVILL
jgi:hypothetical protein